MAQNKKTSEIIRKFGTFEMCNTPEEIQRYKETNGQYELCTSVVHSGCVGCGKTYTIATAFGIYWLEAQQRGLTERKTSVTHCWKYGGSQRLVETDIKRRTAVGMVIEMPSCSDNGCILST